MFPLLPATPWFISIHALCEEGDRSCKVTYGGIEDISIHALCEEGDINFRCLVLAIGQFLSTPSARRATRVDWYDTSYPIISIHALCEEGDPW